MAWAPFSPAFWISPGVHSMLLISPSRLWVKIFLDNTYLAYVAGVWLVAAGLAILWRRSARIGAAASAIAYLIFAALWLARYYAGIHALGWRIDVILGVTFGLAQQLMLVAPAAIVYASTASPDSLLAKESSYRRTLDARIASCHLRPISPHRPSRLRDHRPALDVVWIFLGGADRNRLHPGRMCNLLRNRWMSWPSGFLR